jgi:hypothetical protein
MPAFKPETLAAIALALEMATADLAFVEPKLRDAIEATTPLPRSHKRNAGNDWEEGQEAPILVDFPALQGMSGNGWKGGMVDGDGFEPP